MSNGPISPAVPSNTGNVAAALEGTTGAASGLPGRCYFSDTVFAAERKQLFAPSWIPIAFESDLENIGDAMPVTFANWELLLVRGIDGALRCFQNVCRHRGMKLVKEKTNLRKIVCSYHCWGYGLAGELQSTPNIGGIGIGDAPGIEKSELGLIAVRADVWNGVIFVNLDGAALGLHQSLAPVNARLRALDFSQLKSGTLTRDIDLGANWKIFVEGGIEDYHLPYVHTKTLSGYAPNYRVEDCPGVYAGFSQKRMIGEARERYKGDAGDDETLPMWPAVVESGVAETVALFLQPLGLVFFNPMMFSASVILPQSATRTLVRTMTWYSGEGATSPKYAAARTASQSFFSKVILEDITVMEEMQHMSKVREDLNVRTRFSPHWERALQSFQAGYARKMDTALA